MKYIYTLLLLFFFHALDAQMPVGYGGNKTGIPPGANPPQTPPPADTTTKKVYMCSVRATTGNGQPLMVVDGVIQDISATFKALKPEDIEEVFVIKSPAATTLYGNDGRNGVIVIVTKKMRERKLLVTDFVSGAAVPNATIHIESADKKEQFDFVADENGLVKTDKLKSGTTYQLHVSSIGYTALDYTYASRYKDSATELKLSRNRIACDTVIISGINPRFRGCGGMRIRATNVKAYPAAAETKNDALTVFPNPASKGQFINLHWQSANTTVSQVSVLSLDGKLILTRNIPAAMKAQQKYVLQTDSRMASGIYFLQLLCEKGRVIASGKIAIQ